MVQIFETYVDMVYCLSAGPWEEVVDIHAYWTCSLKENPNSTWRLNLSYTELSANVIQLYQCAIVADTSSGRWAELGTNIHPRTAGRLISTQRLSLIFTSRYVIGTDGLSHWSHPSHWRHNLFQSPPLRSRWGLPICKTLGIHSTKVNWSWAPSDWPALNFAHDCDWAQGKWECGDYCLKRFKKLYHPSCNK